jgi:acyl dehydratase
MTAGFLSHLVTDWVGDGRLRKYKIRFTRQVWPGDTITCQGKITKKYTADGKNYIEAHVFAENQRGEKVITGAMAAEVPNKPAV